MPRFDLLGEAPGEGDAAAGAARSRPWLRVRVSVSEGKNEQGREREQGRGVLFFTGEHGSAWAGAAATRVVELGRYSGELQEEEETPVFQKPPELFSFPFSVFHN